MEGMAMEIGLDKLKVGQQGVVQRMETDPLLALRLKSFGLVPTTGVLCRYRSPGGSVIALEFGRTVVALRARDAQKIRVCC
jgi:Fe2+ transport system protein FeoA